MDDSFPENWKSEEDETQPYSPVTPEKGSKSADVLSERSAAAR